MKSSQKKLEYNRQYRLKNKDKISAKLREKYDKNPEKYRKEKLLSDSKPEIKAKRKIRDAISYQDHKEERILKERSRRRTDAARNTVLKRQYGITINQYNQILEQQNFRCAICSVPHTESKRLRVDHCHKNGKVRGLLCHNCNVAAGLLKDNSVFAINLSKYLSK